MIQVQLSTYLPLKNLKIDFSDNTYLDQKSVNLNTQSSNLLGILIIQPLIVTFYLCKRFDIHSFAPFLT